MHIPTTLKHKPVLVAEDYGRIDGRTAYGSDAQGLSLGLASGTTGARWTSPPRCGGTPGEVVPPVGGAAPPPGAGSGDSGLPGPALFPGGGLPLPQG